MCVGVCLPLCIWFSMVLINVDLPDPDSANKKSKLQEQKIIVKKKFVLPMTNTS